MTETVSIADDGADAAREALETTVAGGGIAIFPADGLYGLACDPADPKAVELTYDLKGRDEDKPCAVMYFSSVAMRDLLDALPPLTRAAVAGLLPGPVTLIVYNPKQRFPLACREDPERLGVRRIEGPFSGTAFPIFQTSANRSGEPAPASFEQIDVALLSEVDLAIDGGKLSGKPSTVVDLTAIEAGGPWEVLRQGALPYEELEKKLTGLQLG